MKWFALVLGIGSIWPLANWLRHNSRGASFAWGLMGFMPFAIGPFHLYMAIISWASWPGYVKGAEVSLLDLLAIALLLGLPRSGRGPPFRFAMVLYFLAALASTVQSAAPMAGMFFLWELLRSFLLYYVVARGCVSNRVVSAVLSGMIFGLLYQAGDSLWERFFAGVLQSGGSLGHQNLLGLMTHFVVFPCAALLLAGAPGWQPAVGPAVGLLVAVLTVSRATIGLAAFGYAATFALSAFRGWTSRKAYVLATAICATVILVPLVQSSFQKRFQENPLEADSYDERAAFQAAAKMMLADHPMGVGPNYYVVAANMGGYNVRARVAPVAGSEGANVHNLYLLVGAETGYLGLGAWVLVLLQPMLVAFRYGWRAKRDLRGDFLIGVGVALAIVYLHSFYEWIFISSPPLYLFAMEVGMVAGLATQLGYRRSRVAGHPMGANLDRDGAGEGRAPEEFSPATPVFPASTQVPHGEGNGSVPDVVPCGAEGKPP